MKQVAKKKKTQSQRVNIMLIRLTASRINPFLSHCGDFTDALTQQKRRISATKKNKQSGRPTQPKRWGLQPPKQGRHACVLVPLWSTFSDLNVFCLVSQYKHLLLTRVLVRWLEQYYHNTVTVIKVAATCQQSLHLVKRWILRGGK